MCTCSHGPMHVHACVRVYACVSGGGEEGRALSMQVKACYGVASWLWACSRVHARVGVSCGTVPISVSVYLPPSCICASFSSSVFVRRSPCVCGFVSVALSFVLSWSPVSISVHLPPIVRVVPVSLPSHAYPCRARTCYFGVPNIRLSLYALYTHAFQFNLPPHMWGQSGARVDLRSTSCTSRS